MGTLNHILTFRRDGGHNDHYTGGGDRRRPEQPGYYERLRRYRIAVGVLLVGVTMIFVALSSAYVVRQGWASEDPHTHVYRVDWKSMQLPYTLLFINTGVLLLSSLTLEMARRN